MIMIKVSKFPNEKYMLIYSLFILLRYHIVISGKISGEKYEARSHNH